MIRLFITSNIFVQRLPHSLGLLDHTQQHVASLRKKQPYASLPVITWPHFMHSIRTDVNPLASEAHCRQLMQQLQLIGEVGVVLHVFMISCLYFFEIVV